MQFLFRSLLRNGGLLLRKRVLLLQKLVSLLRNRGSLLQKRGSLVRNRGSLLRKRRSLLRNRWSLLRNWWSLLLNHKIGILMYEIGVSVFWHKKSEKSVFTDKISINGRSDSSQNVDLLDSAILFRVGRYFGYSSSSHGLLGPVPQIASRAKETII